MKEQIKEFIKLKLESTSNNTAIARQVIKEFELEDQYTLDAMRFKVGRTRVRLEKKGSKRELKRLFADIETSFVYAPVWRAGEQYISPMNIKGEVKIICISYKWQYENEVHTLTWDENQDDKQLLKKFIKILGEADEVIGHNFDRFDLRQIRTRAIRQGVLMYPKYRTLDTLKKARKYFSFMSNKLDYLGRVLEVGRKLDHEGLGLWKRVQEGDSKDLRSDALKEMVSYCEQDVILLEDVFNVVQPYIDHNTNHAVLKHGLHGKWRCPNCSSEDVNLSHTDATPVGYIKRHMRCNTCKQTYHVSNRTYQQFITRIEK
jgi:hypothetical protein